MKSTKEELAKLAGDVGARVLTERDLEDIKVSSKKFYTRSYEKLVSDLSGYFKSISSYELDPDGYPIVTGSRTK